MISYYLSKPLQSSLFQTHRNTLMGITSDQIDQYKLEYATVNILRAKAASNCLSVWKDGYDQDIYIYIYIYMHIYNHDHKDKECVGIVKINQ